MTGFRLVRLHGEQPQDEWLLPLDRPLEIGRCDALLGRADVDLTPDRSVSRRHARVWFENGSYWIADLSSKHGTRIAGRSVAREVPLRLEEGTEIECGQTRMLLLPSTSQRMRAADLTVDLTVNRTVTYAHLLSLCKVVGGILIRNVSDHPHPGGTLQLSLGEFGYASVVVAPLAAREGRVVPSPHFVLDSNRMEGLSARRWQSMSVSLGGQTFQGDAIGCWILPHNQWSFARDQQSALAAFVLPSHPMIPRLSQQRSNATAVRSPEAVLAAVYQELLGARIGYCHEPVLDDVDSQVIRLPHQIFLGGDLDEGRATCLDLALLIAGCLEASGVQPLVAILESTEGRHAIVGCWEQVGPRLEPILGDTSRLSNRAVWLDPNGCTRDPHHRKTFADAKTAARTALLTGRLCFAIDIAAARSDGIKSLPFNGEAPFATEVQRAVNIAQEVCLQRGAQLGTVALLIGLASLEDGMTRTALQRFVDPARALNPLVDGIGKSESPMLPSRNYTGILEAARARAKAEGALTVNELHLLTAVLLSSSTALDAALEHIGVEREALLALVRQAALSGLDPDQSHFNPSRR